MANAGILSWGNAWELSSQAWNELIDVNLTGVFHTIRATVPHMIKQGTGGSIILTSSSAGLKGQPFTLAYTAAKHGVVGITRGSGERARPVRHPRQQHPSRGRRAPR